MCPVMMICHCAELLSVCSSPQWYPVAIQAPHPIPRCPGTATLWGRSCATAAPASGLWWETPPACVGWTATGQALSPTAQVWGLVWGRGPMDGRWVSSQGASVTDGWEGSRPSEPSSHPSQAESTAIRGPKWTSAPGV